MQYICFATCNKQLLLCVVLYYRVQREMSVQQSDLCQHLNKTSLSLQPLKLVKVNIYRFYLHNEQLTFRDWGERGGVGRGMERNVEDSWSIL